MKITLPATLLRPFSAFALTIAAFTALSLAPTDASAQSDITTIRGDFKDSNGNKGTYVATITKDGTSTTEQVVFTRKSDQATSTDTTTTVKNTDGSRTVNFSHNNFGATAQFTSAKTVTPEKHGQAYGTGTYTTAEGVSGTVTTLESGIGGTTAVNSTRASANGTTIELRLRESGLGFTADKIITLNPDGTVSAAINTRFITHVE